MALNQLVDSRDVRFVLFEMLGLDKLTQYPKFADFDKSIFEDVLDLAETISVEQVYPANELADKTGVDYNPDTKEVKLPEDYKNALLAYYEAGFAGLALDPEYGGMGMPDALFQAATEYFTAPGAGFTMYPHLVVGVSNLLINFGSDEQKALYLEKIISGEWGGTMCLTESDAGSDVGALKTKAVKQDDGTYLITGQKIFISAGDHDAAGNIVHAVLARIDGDPEGTKGISLFIVPKYRVNEDGSIGEANDVIASGIEHKMGLRGSATCTLSFGDNGQCKGYLLGEERKGMRLMFHMMNESRLFVGLQGLALSSAAYMHSITYAKNRIQGTDVKESRNPDAKPIAIVNHPDIRRTLLWMKSYVEAMRMLTYYLGYKIDLTHVLDGEEAKEAQAIVDFFIPVCKAGNSDNAWLVTSEAIQIYGGYGYCSDYPVERLARDSKILSLYEGTNGIQAIDLIMRKILTNKEQYNLNVVKKSIENTITEARGVVDEKYITPIENGIKKLEEVVTYLKSKMAEGEMDYIFTSAAPFLKAVTMLTLAWMQLWNLTLTLPKSKELIGDKAGSERAELLKENNEAAYYEGKVLSGRFFIGSEFRKFFGMMDNILTGETAVSEITNDIFTGAPEE